MAMNLHPGQDPFAKVIDEFKAKLKNDKLYAEILKTTSIEQVYDLTDKLQLEQGHKSHLRYLSKIQPFLEQLRGYSGVIETFVQAKPEILSLIWGPIKLLIQWASTLKQSLDAIINTTGEIGELLPEFTEVAKLFENNQLLGNILALFFQDVLDFYVVALDFFSKKRWQYLFEALWPKLSERIKIVVNHIERHTSLMRNEVRLEHIREEHDLRKRTLDHFEKQERFNQSQEYNIIKTGISPKFYDDVFNLIKGRVCSGTGKWLLKDPTFIKWLDTTDISTRVVWLQGIPGAGKTFLASTAMQEALKTNRTVFAFLSHEYSTSTSALSILCSLAFQLTAEDFDLQATLCQSKHGDLRNNVSAATNLLKALLNCAGSVYILIDGVDEINETERKILLDQLLDLSKDCEQAKILVSSRPVADVAKILDPTASIIRIDTHNAGSIQTFITRRTKEWLDDRAFLPEIEAEIKGLLAPLAANAKGMFLYAEVILKNIEFLSSIEEIRQELKVYPKDLNACYARILQRINRLPSASMTRAKSILGWISCSPIPLTIQELEQALLINSCPSSGARVSSTLNIVQLCGPIVEIVGDQVHFVHFTVKEYVDSPNMDGIGNFIDPVKSTLDLAICCVRYLSEDHHDSFLDDDEVELNILSGDYRLHYYASVSWLGLVERYLALLGSNDLSSELLSALDCLVQQRSRLEFDSDFKEDELASSPTLERLIEEYPDIYALLLHARRFRQKASTSGFQLKKVDAWVHLEPLTTSNISKMLYKQLSKLVCSDGQHSDTCSCSTLERHYGQRLFKCGFLGCTFYRQGFSTKALRKSHAKYHDGSWKCSFDSCHYAEIGFLSRRMRDEHMDTEHKENQLQTNIITTDLDVDDIQPLLFDLVRSDNIPAVKVLLPHLTGVDFSVKKELQTLVAFSGSCTMLHVLADEFGYQSLDQLTEAAILGGNHEVLSWLLSLNRKPFTEESLTYLLAKGSAEIFECFANYLPDMISLKGCKSYVKAGVIRATKRIPVREQFLLSIWGNLYRRSSRFRDERLLYFGLNNVGSTTCSINLAQALLKYGVRMNDNTEGRQMTCLQLACRKNSPAAAEFIKFLLYQGAKPKVICKISKKNISEEKGAVTIERWLGVSWDQLIEKVKEDRKNGITWPG